jgi:hypothetical protein
VNHDEVLSFNKKIKNVTMEILRSPSFTNPALLKEELSGIILTNEFEIKHEN